MILSSICDVPSLFLINCLLYEVVLAHLGRILDAQKPCVCICYTVQISPHRIYLFISQTRTTISFFTPIVFSTAELSSWLYGKESTRQVGDTSLISGLGRSPGEGNGNPLQYSCLENPVDRGVWQATVYGVAKELDMP